MTNLEVIPQNNPVIATCEKSRITVYIFFTALRMWWKSGESDAGTEGRRPKGMADI